MATNVPVKAKAKAKLIPSPYSLTLTTLISLHCEQLESSPLYSDLEDPPKSHEAVQLFLQKALNARNLTEAMLASKPVKSIIDDLEKSAGTEVSSKFLKWLKIATASIDALIDLMATARNATQSGYVDASSLTGTFVRDVSLGFESLSFEMTARLWQCFRAEVTQADSVKSTTAHFGASGDVSSSSDWTQHPHQIESGLRHLLQHEGSMDGIVNSLFGGLPHESSLSPPTTTHRTTGPRKVRLENLQNHENLPSLHLLQFLHSARQGERVESVEQLHSYFDRALILSEENDGASRHIMQFAPILLSALHCQTGNTDISRLATEEAARVAQHSQDTASVAFALGWLYENGVSTGRVGDVNILNRCASRAAQGERQNLLTGAEFLLVRQTLLANRKDQRLASRAWTHLFDATSELPSTEASSVLDRPTRTSNVSNANVCLDAMARQRIVASSVWESVGQASAAALSSLVCLQSNPRLSSEDARAAIQNVTRQCQFGSHPLLEGLSDTTKNQSTTNTDDISCVYGRATRELVQLGEKFGLSLKEELGRELQLVLHEWAVRRCDFEDADGLMRLLLSNLRPYESKALRPLLQMKLQEAFMYSQKEDHAKARKILDDLLSSCKKGGMLADEGQILLQRAVQHLQSAPEFSVNALGPIIDCLSLCENLQLEGLKGPALSILGHLFLCMDEPELSISTLRAALPPLLQNSHVWFQGQAFLNIAKCYLRLAKPSQGAHEPTSRRKVRTALKYLKRAESILSTCHDAKGLREVYYLQARLQPDDLQARKMAAEKFVAISRHISTGGSRVAAIGGMQDKKHFLDLSTRPLRT